MDVTKVKALLRIDHNRYDDYLTETIPRVKAFAESYCNRTFDDPIPADIELFIAKACEYFMIEQGLQSKQMGEVQYVFDIEERYPRTLLVYLKPYKKLRFN